MADTKITALTANNAPLGTDLTIIIDDPAGTALSQKITLADLFAAWISDAGYDPATWTSTTIGASKRAISAKLETMTTTGKAVALSVGAAYP